jgi:membrane-associated phospholipid phosphatase
MRAMYGAMRAERMSPPVASRLLTYTAAAWYAGIATEQAGLGALTGRLNGFPRLPEGNGPRDGLVVATAANRVIVDSLLREALPITRSTLLRLADSLEAARTTAGVGRDAMASSRNLGRDIGLRIVSWSRDDNFDKTRGRTYAAPVGPGLWVNDAPASVYASQSMSGASELVTLDNPANVMQAGSASDRALILSRQKRAVASMPPVNMAGISEPFWADVRPFALTSWDECAVAAPPVFTTDTASALYREARAVYDAKARLTAEEKTIALYWADNAGESGTPVGHWISIASQIATEKQLDAGATARLMLLTAVAQADAFIASWGYKYTHNLLRPRTYIRQVIDSTWEPLIPTPPFPEYPSGHSTQSAAAADVMTSLLGALPFHDSTSVVIGHDVRAFDSFTAASDEAGLSRIYAGIHFPIGNTAGRALGRCIGAHVVTRLR